MDESPKSFDDQSWVVLPEAIEKAFGRMEFFILDEDGSKLFSFEATRKRCKIEFTWNRFTAGIAVIVALIAGITKFWS